MIPKKEKTLFIDVIYVDNSVYNPLFSG